MRKLLVFAALTVITLWTPLGLAQTTDDLKTLKKDVDALKEGQGAIHKELQEIKGLLQQGRPSAAAPPREAVVTLQRSYADHKLPKGPWPMEDLPPDSFEPAKAATQPKRPMPCNAHS